MARFLGRVTVTKGIRSDTVDGARLGSHLRKLVVTVTHTAKAVGAVRHRSNLWDGKRLVGLASRNIYRLMIPFLHCRPSCDNRSGYASAAHPLFQVIGQAHAATTVPAKLLGNGLPD
jgi:hypothetical protein